MKGGDKVITGQITIHNLRALHETDNSESKLTYTATVFIEGKHLRTMTFTRLESAHKFIHLYMEGNKDYDA